MVYGNVADHMSGETRARLEESTDSVDGLDPRKVPSRIDGGTSLTDMTEVIGRKWQPVLVGRLLEDGPQGFSTLKEQVDGISGKVLSENLKELEERGVVERSIVSTRPHRVEYSLTERGRALEPVIVAMYEWGNKYL